MEETLLNKATEMFLQYGFKSVTMDDIATELGMSKKTVYAHYPTKSALVEAVAINVFESISKGIDEIRSRNLNPIEEIYVIKDFVRKLLKDEQSSPEFQLCKYYPDVHEKMHGQKLETMMVCVTENLKKGIDQGLFRESMKPEYIARFYFGGIAAIKDTTLFPTNEFTPVTTMDEFVEYHLRAIVTPEGEKILKQHIDENND